MKNSKGSLAEKISFIRRALSIISEITPGRVSINIIKAIIDALTPYISIYMSALIIDELMGQRNTSTLVLYVLITTGGTLFFHVISALLQNRITLSNGLFYQRFKKYLNNVKLNLDFEKMEDPKYNELHAKIVGSMFMTNGGITAVVGLVTSLVTNGIACIMAIVILAGTFLKTSGKPTPLASIIVGVLY